MDKWIGKIAVVTGASAGIGAQIIKDLAESGITVIGLARRPEKIEELVKGLGDTQGKIHAIKCDVSDLTSIKEAFNAIETKFGGVNILINNAGIGANTSILAKDIREEDGESFNKTINTNFSGLVHVTRYAFPLMVKADEYGMIVNINSIAGHITPFPKDGVSKSNVYHGTKHAVTSTTEVLRQELVCMNNKKIRVSSVSPGVVETDFFAAAKFLPEDVKIGNFLPALNPADISSAILYLLSTPYHVNITEITVRPVGESF